jgi:hypothetical protein
MHCHASALLSQRAVPTTRIALNTHGPLSQGSPPKRTPFRAIGAAFVILEYSAATSISQRYSAYAAKRSRVRMTVIADHGLPVGVATLRSFWMRAISALALRRNRP